MQKRPEGKGKSAHVPLPSQLRGLAIYLVLPDGVRALSHALPSIVLIPEQIFRMGGGGG